ncbi:glyoxalase [Pullulanibacillus camelliae]|uniref:Glyoxalase n=1 Tax=Pullulanibacillus camelliae TaxID=1707096 RepID=A0A8J2YHU5_9BACL|nr:VOC family protein [Pullulanibacillus camelliae]GGE44029.1 glyoxalase [Pullulanibacillus camelliae]
MSFHQKPNIVIDTIHLLVTDMERSLKFYQNILGFGLLKRNQREALLTVDGHKGLITLETSEQVLPRQPRRTGLYHFALLLPDRQALAQMLLHLLKVHYPLEGASDHLVSEALYLSDPDGNGIEIYADRPSETWEWQNGQVSMLTKALDAEDLLEESGGTGLTELPSNTLMGHIHLHVSDLQAAERFYCDGLGFRIVSRYGHQALFISTGGYHHHIGLNVWNGVGAPAPDKNSVGLKWMTLKYPDEGARLHAVEQLQQMGVGIEEREGDIWTQDPSGTQIKLMV